MRANRPELFGTGIASRRLRAADIASKINEAVAGIGLLLLRNGIGKYSLDLQGILQFLGIKSEPSADADAMRIRNDTGDPENVAEQEIGDLPSDSGKLAELIYISRQLAAVFIAELDASRLDRRRLSSVKSAGTDDRLDILKRCVSK